MEFQKQRDWGVECNTTTLVVLWGGEIFCCRDVWGFLLFLFFPCQSPVCEVKRERGHEPIERYTLSTTTPQNGTLKWPSKLPISGVQGIKHMQKTQETNAKKNAPEQEFVA